MRARICGNPRAKTSPTRVTIKTRVNVDALRMRPDGTLALRSRPQYLSHISHEEIAAAVEADVLRVKRRPTDGWLCELR